MFKHNGVIAISGKGKVIVEGFVDFDYEITLLTVRHVDGTSYLEPVGHRQVDGDYQEYWQPQPMGEPWLSWTTARIPGMAAT